MDQDNIFRPYDEIKDNLKFITSSDVRMKIILSLKNDKKKLSDLKKDINISSSTILHNMRQLESNKIIKKEFQDYSLSQIGEIIAQNIMNMIQSIYFTKKNEDYWLNHEINGIPENLISKLDYLEGSLILENERKNKLFNESLDNTEDIKWIFSNFDKNILFDNIINKKKNIDLIFAEDSLIDILNIRDENKNNSFNIMTLWRYNSPLKLNMILLDDLMCLNLPNINSNHENRFCLVDESKKGIEWGNKLFEHYMNRSNEFINYY